MRINLSEAQGEWRVPAVSILNRLERHLSPFAIPGLMRYVAALNALVFLLVTLNPEYLGVLVLDRNLVLQGQVWRLISWLFIPNTFSFFFILFFLSFLWFIGDMLEATWGTFRLNLYYFLGAILITLTAFIFNTSLGNQMLCFSLLLAIATIAPDEQVLLLFFPIKMKWAALLSLILWGMMFVGGSTGLKCVILVSLGNYFLFFGPAFIRQFREQRSTAIRRAKFEAARVSDDETLHRCATCGITEVSNPEADFRVAPNGHEYCLRHLPEN